MDTEVSLLYSQEPVLTLSKINPVHAPFHFSKTQFNLLKLNDVYICRTAALTSRRYILNIYSTNIHTEYFKHAA